MRPPPSRLSDYPLCESFTTRWADNDVYGHINNAAYYGFIDTAVNRFMIARAGVDIHAGPVIALVVETGCRYFAELAFPDPVTAGIRVGRLGTSSVRYEVGLFRGEADTAAAEGFFVHVYVDRHTRRPAGLASALGISSSLAIWRT